MTIEFKAVFKDEEENILESIVSQVEEMEYKSGKTLQHIEVPIATLIKVLEQGDTLIFNGGGMYYSPDYDVFFKIEQKDLDDVDFDEVLKFSKLIHDSHPSNESMFDKEVDKIIESIVDSLDEEEGIKNFLTFIEEFNKAIAKLEDTQE